MYIYIYIYILASRGYSTVSNSIEANGGNIFPKLNQASYINYTE